MLFPGAPKVPQFMDWTSKSKAYSEVLSVAKGRSELDLPIFIAGEFGTGKKALALWIHRYRERLEEKKLPFFVVDSSMLSKEFVEKRFLKLGSKATFLFSGVNFLSLDLQLKIYDWVKYRNGPYLILTSDADLESEVISGEFSQLLYSEMKRFKLVIPPLCDRKEDIPGIIRALIPDSCEYTKTIAEFSDIPVGVISHFTSLCTEKKVTSVHGIRLRLDHFLEFSPKDNQGKLNFACWEELLNKIEEFLSAPAGRGPITQVLLPFEPSWSGTHRLDANMFQTDPRIQ